MNILVINPGSTSTKIGVFADSDMIYEQTFRHSDEELRGFDSVIAQLDFRTDIICGALDEEGIDRAKLNAVIGRGGLLKPIASGTYEVNAAMVADLETGHYGQHASNLGGLIAARIASASGAQAFIADPVVVDEMEDVARVTGMPELRRRSVFHALNQKAVARIYAESIGKRYEDLNLIVAHMGGGISVGAHRKGRVVDVNNALDGDGPFSPERAGSLPSGDLVRLAFSGKYTEAELLKMINGRGGIVAHLGTNDTRIVAKMDDEGDDEAKLVREAMCYNVAKWIGSMAAVLEGGVDAIILTGGIAYGRWETSRIEQMVGKFAPVVVMGGENELEALADNALRVLKGQTAVCDYR